MEATRKENLKIGRRVRGFFDRHYPLFFAPVIVGFLYVFALWQGDVYPFGDKYTAASYDLSAQIAPFIEHLFDVLDGKSTWSFSYAIVGGADVTGTFLYFFISPFSFLFLIFGDGKVAHASSIVMLCKLMAISVAGTWFAKKLFRGIPDYICIAVGIAYAYCGYTFVANTYINWMDFLIYMPFCVGGFRRFVKTGKFFLFSALMACCIYTCFSIACFSMFTVFPALIAYGLLCVEKEKKNKFIAYLCLSFAVAILMALPVLLPALGAYSVSGRGGDLFENLWYGYSVDSVTGALGSFNESTFSESYMKSLYRKLSYILSDSVFVVLTLVWFFRKGLKDKFARFMLVAGVLTLLPVFVDEAMNLLNMGSYMSYALRFGFLNALYFLGGACLCIEGWCYRPFTDREGNALLEKREGDEGGRCALKRIFCKENKKSLLWAGGLILLTVTVTVFLFWFTTDGNYQKFLALFHSDAKGFAASFAHSLGGLDVIVVPFIAVAVLALVGCLLVRGKKVSPRLLSILLIVVAGVQVFFYNDTLVVGNRSLQHEALGSYQVLSEELNRREGENYFRVKDYNDKMTACSPFTANSNSFSVFSSVIDADNFVTFQLFGYKGNGKNSFKSAHNTDKKNRSDEFGDSFLGYKYFVSTQKTNSKSYVTPVYELDEEGNPKLDSEGNKIQLADGDLYVFENTLVFPTGYKVESTESFRFVSENVGNKTYRSNNQKALYKYLYGVETPNTHVNVSDVEKLSAKLNADAADVQVGAGKITAKVTAEAGESLFLSFVAVDGYEVTVNGKKAALIENDLKFLQVALEEGENEVVFTYTSPYGKLAIYGVIVGGFGLLVAALVLKKTRIAEKTAPVIAWAGILLAMAVTVFFMIYPTGVFLAKVVDLIKIWIG